jgi:hypothetical protein
MCVMGNGSQREGIESGDIGKMPLDGIAPGRTCVLTN